MFFTWVSMHMVSYVKSKKLKYAVLFSSIPLFLLSSLRYGVGTDFFSYIRIFKLAEQGIFSKSEFLFNFVNVAISYIGLSEQWLFIVFTTIFCFFTYLAIFEESPYPVISVFLLIGMNFYFASMNVMRELIGVAILLYGIKFIISKELKKYLLCVIASFGFHFSCILFLPFYWLRNFKMTRKKAVFFTVLIALSSSFLSKYFLEALPLFNLEHYVGSRFDDGKVGFIYIALQLTIDAFLLWKYQPDIKYNILFIIQLVNTWVAFFSGSVPLISRLRYLFGFPCIILIPLAISKIENKFLRAYITVIIIITFSIYVYFVANSGHSGVLPYNSILDFLF